MLKNTSEIQHYSDDEINFKVVFESLAKKKWFIFQITSIVTILATLYVLFVTPTYQASISLLSPKESSVFYLHKLKLITGRSETKELRETSKTIEKSEKSEKSETSETIYRSFLNMMMSREFQRKVFEEYNYINRINIDNIICTCCK